MANQFIPLDQAAKMTRKYRENRENMLTPTYQGKNVLAICETFDREEFDKVLAQEGCVGLRIYLGMSEDLQVKSVICGVNAKNEDMIPDTTAASKSSSASTTSGDENSQIIDQARRCPDDCPPDSALNH